MLMNCSGVDVRGKEDRLLESVGGGSLSCSFLNVLWQVKIEIKF